MRSSARRRGVRIERLEMTSMMSGRRVFFSRPLFGERPGQHELGLEHRPGAFNHAVEGGGDPADNRMLHAALDRGEHLAAIAFEPVAVEGFGDHPELDDEVAGEVLRLGFAALFPPEAEEGGLVIAHDNAGVGAADEAAPMC